MSAAAEVTNPCTGDGATTTSMIQKLNLGHDAAEESLDPKNVPTGAQEQGNGDAKRKESDQLFDLDLDSSNG